MTEPDACRGIDELAVVVRTAMCLRVVRAREILGGERAGESYDAAHAGFVISK